MTDETYLLDMLNSARKVLAFSTGLDAASFRGSELHQSAIVKQLEIIGEAANRVSTDFRDAHPEIPWRQIVGMRHRLVHDYRWIQVDTVWQTVQDDISPLIRAIEPLVVNAIDESE